LFDRTFHALRLAPHVQVLQGYSTASMTRAEQAPTCGQGLAENSALPARISELLATLAQVLETHRRALDLEDENSRHEDEVYRELAEQFRGVAAALRSTAERMASHAGLPMGRHRLEEVASPRMRGMFLKFLSLEQELQALLQKRFERDSALLLQMVGAGR
jgi:hypothetical protein